MIYTLEITCESLLQASQIMDALEAAGEEGEVEGAFEVKQIDPVVAEGEGK